MSDTLAQLAAHLLDRTRDADRRYVIGVVGTPGSGKSTFANALREAVNVASQGDAAFNAPPAVVLPMDGFHLPNARLDAEGLRARKGAPITFDGEAFVDLIERLHHEFTLFAPEYSRKLHEPVANAITIDEDHRLVIVEGNYLLLDAAPWCNAAAVLDETWYLDLPVDVCMQRVRARHIAGGCDEQTADRKLATNDRLNAWLVEQSKARATRIITPPTL